MSGHKEATAKIGVQISKETGGAYADVREVIESELVLIRDEWTKRDNSNGAIRDTDKQVNDNHRTK